MKVLHLAIIIATVAGCGGDPCEDYCRTFVEKTQSCGLGGPSGDAVIQQCGDQISLTDAQCSNDEPGIRELSCAEFKAIVCEQPDAAQTYRCN